MEHPKVNPEIKKKLQEEFNELDRTMISIDGSWLKPSQCYHFGDDPVHVLFNTNCPDDLKQRIEGILSKYISSDESSIS